MTDNPDNLPEKIGQIAATTARDRLLDAFEQHGVTDDLIALVGADLLTATKVKSQWSAKDRHFVYSKQLADNTTRYNTLKLLMEFRDAMPSKKVDITDKRQTRDLANALFAKIEEAGQLGHDEKHLPVMEAQEMELMGDMWQEKQAREGAEGQEYVSLIPEGVDD